MRDLLAVGLHTRESLGFTVIQDNEGELRMINLEEVVDYSITVYLGRAIPMLRHRVTMRRGTECDIYQALPSQFYSFDETTKTMGPEEDETTVIVGRHVIPFDEFFARWASGEFDDYDGGFFKYGTLKKLSKC